MIACNQSNNFRMHATNATFFALPRAKRRR